MKARLLSTVVVAGALLTACTSPATTPEPAPAGTDSERSSFDLACEDAVPSDLLTDLWGEDLGPLPFPTVSAAGSWEMQGTALLQDGALACTWGTSPSDRRHLVVLALDDAEEGFLRSESSFLDGPFPYVPAYVGDSSMTLCRSDDASAGIQCHWNVLAGDTWLSFFFQNLPDAELTEYGEAYRDGAAGAIVDVVIENVAASERMPVGTPEVTIEPCEQRFTPELVAGVLGLDPTSVLVESGRSVEESLGKSTPLFGQTMWAFAFERQGYSECQYLTETSTRGAVIVAPGAAWVLEHSGFDQPENVEIDGYGSGIDTCRTESGYTLCTRAVAVGDDLVLAQVEDDGTGIGATWAANLVDRLITP